MEWNYVEQLIGKFGVAGTAMFGAWKAYQRFVKPFYSWCKNQLGLVRKVNGLDATIHYHELKLESLIRLSPFPIFIADHETGSIIYVNAAWRNIFDLSLDEANNWNKRILEVDKIRFSWQETLTKKILFDEKFTITSNNKKLLVNCKAIVQKNRNDKFVQIVGIIVEL